MMKRFLSFGLAAALALCSLAANAQLVDKQTRIQQWDATVGSFYSRDLLPPAGAADGIFWYNATSGKPEYLLLGSGLSVSSGVLSAAGGGSPTCAAITDATATGCSVLTAINASAARTAIGAGTSNFNGAYSSLTGAPALAPVATSGQYADLTGKPTIPAAQVNSDWGASSGVSQILNKPSLATVATSGSYNDLSNKPTIPTVTPFSFSQPAARTLAMSTSYQATDNTKAAVIYPSYSCTNATTVLAASGCTVQVRMGSSSVTCSTGTVYYTQSLTVQLGVLITQASINPVPIFLPIGGYFILCPTTGTFTTSTVEQSVG